MKHSAHLNEYGDIFLASAGNGSSNQWQIAKDQVLLVAQSIREQSQQIEATELGTGSIIVETADETVSLNGTPSEFYSLARELEGTLR